MRKTTIKRYSVSNVTLKGGLNDDQIKMSAAGWFAAQVVEYDDTVTVIWEKNIEDPRSDNELR